jgi:hypothetical protein
MNLEEVVEKIIALRDVSKKTGLITKRAQNALLVGLSDAELADVAVKIKNEEQTNERNQTPN